MKGFLDRVKNIVYICLHLLDFEGIAKICGRGSAGGLHAHDTSVEEGVDCINWFILYCAKMVPPLDQDIIILSKSQIDALT